MLTTPLHRCQHVINKGLHSTPVINSSLEGQAPDDIPKQAINLRIRSTESHDPSSSHPPPSPSPIAKSPPHAAHEAPRSLSAHFTVTPHFTGTPLLPQSSESSRSLSGSLHRKEWAVVLLSWACLSAIIHSFLPCASPPPVTPRHSLLSLLLVVEDTSRPLQATSFTPFFPSSPPSRSFPWPFSGT